MLKNTPTTGYPVPKKNHPGIGSQNQETVNITLARYGNRSFPAMPDWSRRRRIRGHLRKELEKGFEFRLKRLSLELERALHQVREETNHALVMNKAHLRKERMEYFANSYNEMVERFNDLAEEFLRSLDSRFERLNRYKNDAIREREEMRLNNTVDTFLSSLDQLIDEYRSIISEQVDHQ